MAQTACLRRQEWDALDIDHLAEEIEGVGHSQCHEDLAMRLLSLLYDLEVIVARKRNHQWLFSTPVGTPQHTVKKIYVVDTPSVDLITRYAKAEGVELKDVLNLAFHERFERGQCPPTEE
jgi:Domain of unknown function DUF29